MDCCCRPDFAVAFPTTDAPGHARLRDRVQAALDRLTETPSADFKESAPWETSKWKIIKIALGMGNLRDGGIIVMGVSERNQVWELQGISDADLATYDADDISAAIDKYVSPAVAVEVVLHRGDDKNYFGGRCP